MTRLTYIVATITILLVLCGSASALERFPPPEFESDYQQPRMELPSPRQIIYEYTDIAVLLAALSLAAYLVLKKRSRRAIFFFGVLWLLAKGLCLLDRGDPEYCIVIF